MFLTFLAFIELEKMRIELNKNHFSIIRSLYINATKQAFSKIITLKKQVILMSS
jgi:hypothetical protein